jgi:hypothetical protein
MQQYGDFVASELYCPKCQRSMPVREHLLLVLPDGDLFEYRCAQCATSVGKRTTKGQTPFGIPASPPRRPRALLR